MVTRVKGSHASMKTFKLHMVDYDPIIVMAARYVLEALTSDTQHYHFYDSDNNTVAIVPAGNTLTGPCVDTIEEYK